MNIEDDILFLNVCWVREMLVRGEWTANYDIGQYQKGYSILMSDAVFLGSQRLWRHVSGVVLRSLWESSSAGRSHWLGEDRWLVRIGMVAYLSICRSGPQLKFRKVCRSSTSKTLDEGRGTKWHAPGSAKTSHISCLIILLPYVSINYRGDCQFLKLYHMVEYFCQ